MKEYYLKWRFLGLSEETIEKFKDRVSMDNLRVLNAESVVVAAVCLLTSVAMFILEAPYIELISAMVAAIIQIIIFLFSIELRKSGAKGITKAVTMLISIFQFSLSILAITLGLSSDRTYAAILVGALMVSMVSFDVFPRLNFFHAFGPLVFYLFACVLYKDAEIYIFDILTLGCVFIIGNVISWKKAKVKYEHEECIELIEKNNSVLYKSSLSDSLTGLLNRRVAFERLEVMAAQSSVNKKPIVCMIMDVDHFKSFNDTYGHPAGDVLLSELGSMLSSIQRRHNITMARIGGEEFLTFFVPDKNLSSKTLSKEIMEGMKKINHPDPSKSVTISIGIYENVAETNDTAKLIYSKADKALYEAKRNGRNRMEYYDNSIER